ncbi:MAG: GDYXXLXY domain-containing protein [Verrucomicrobiales bacterium]|nr:GDYXXLXY domain-containing protein [Verrucomicrobiales bacterium]
MKSGFLICLALANLALVVGVIQFHIAGKNAIIENGRTVLLPLLPRDPRSLIQGDYMVLRQGLAREAKALPKSDEVDTRGAIILSIDEKGVGKAVRFHNGGELTEDEHPIAYRRTRRGFRFGIESFFFEEGDAKLFEAAKFAEVKLSDRGEPVLVGLMDENREPLGAPEVQAQGED